MKRKVASTLSPPHTPLRHSRELSPDTNPFKRGPPSFLALFLTFKKSKHTTRKKERDAAAHLRSALPQRERRENHPRSRPGATSRTSESSPPHSRTPASSVCFNCCAHSGFGECVCGYASAVRACPVPRTPAGIFTDCSRFLPFLKLRGRGNALLYANRAGGWPLSLSPDSRSPRLRLPRPLR